VDAPIVDKPVWFVEDFGTSANRLESLYRINNAIYAIAKHESAKSHVRLLIDESGPWLNSEALKVLSLELMHLSLYFKQKERK